jgi:hypothetical protein
MTLILYHSLPINKELYSEKHIKLDSFSGEPFWNLVVDQELRFGLIIIYI